MEHTIVCEKCETVNVLIESKLFFSEQLTEVDILCSHCRIIIKTELTDGWFLILTEEEFIFEQKIEKQKEILISLHNVNT